jgi:uncharacterized membrane protein
MITNSTVVNRPIEAVFDYAAQFERHPEWQDDLVAATIEGPPAVGVKGSETRQMGKRTQTYEWRVSEFDRPNRIGFETISGPVRPAGTIALTSQGDATRVDFQMEVNARGPMKLLTPLISRQIQRSVDAHQAKFKQLLESGTS